MLSYNDLMKDDIEIEESENNNIKSILFKTDRFNKEHFQIKTVYGINGCILFVDAERKSVTVKTKEKKHRVFSFCKTLGNVDIRSIKALFKNENLIITYKNLPIIKAIGIH